MMPPRALIFDVFGTLVDWRSSVAREVAGAMAAKGIDLDPLAFATEWRAEYDPSMAPIREGRRGYTALDILHRENLDTVLARCGLGDRFGEAERATLARTWERLDPWPEVPAALARLRKRALLAPCSNGSTALMARLARHAGFQWDAILGAEIARTYKPHPAVYIAACTALGLAPAEVMMVAAHNADLEAAAGAGLQTAFFPRPTEYGPGQAADRHATGPWTLVARDLADLAERLPLRENP
jgi:2-haloacid dehalogenase